MPAAPLSHFIVRHTQLTLGVLKAAFDPMPLPLHIRQLLIAHFLRGIGPRHLEFSTLHLPDHDSSGDGLRASVFPHPNRAHPYPGPQLTFGSLSDHHLLGLLGKTLPEQVGEFPSPGLSVPSLPHCFWSPPISLPLG